MSEDPAANAVPNRPPWAGWPTDALAGLLTGVITTVSAASLAGLIFAGALAPFLMSGVKIALITATLIGLTIALAGSFRCAIAVPQDRTAPLLAVMAAAIVQSAPPGLTTEQVFLQVVVVIVATTLLTGTSLLLIGAARLGGLMRFLPYSVLGGFFAGTGWLLVLGGLRVMSGLGLDEIGELRVLLQPETLPRWLPGLGLAVAILGLSRRLNQAFALPVLLAAATLGFYLTMFAQGREMADLAAAGWLLSPPGGTAELPLAELLPRLLSVADWALVGTQWDDIATIVMISALSIMLTASGLEMLSGMDTDVNRELRVAGVANLLSAAGGGMVGFHSLGISGLALKLGGRGRLTGVVAALTCAVAMYFGLAQISALPRVVLGGLLLYLGLSFLGTWLIASWNKLPRGEYLLVPLILVVIATAGFVEGIVVGLLAALILFVLSYSRTPMVRYELGGADLSSTVERSLDDERLLRSQGDQLHLLKLRGYLFFGTAAQLTGHIRRRADDPQRPRLRYLLLDLSQVRGVDSSAGYAIHRMRLLATQRGFALLFSGLPPSLRSHLEAAPSAAARTEIHWFDDTDQALEWYELETLRRAGTGHPRRSKGILEHLLETLHGEAAIEHFLAYLDEREYAAGQTLIEQGDAARDLYFIREGEVSVFVRGQDGATKRVRRTGAGTVVGELSFYLGTPRSASVIASGPVLAYRLDTAALQRLEQAHPALAATLHRFVADLLAERLLRNTRTLARLLD